MPSSAYRHSPAARAGLCGWSVTLRGRRYAADVLGEHTCHLSADHFGVHVCYICGCAFNDAGEIFFQRPLPNMPVIFQRSYEA